MDEQFTTSAEKQAAAQTASPDPNEHSMLAFETFYPGTNIHRTTDFTVFEGRRRTLAVKPIDGDGMIPVPYLEWYRLEDGRLSLTLDQRLGIDLPEMTPEREDALIEFLANCIAVGAGYASIYYTKRKVPFRG